MKQFITSNLVSRESKPSILQRNFGNATDLPGIFKIFLYLTKSHLYSYFDITRGMFLLVLHLQALLGLWPGPGPGLCSAFTVHRPRVPKGKSRANSMTHRVKKILLQTMHHAILKSKNNCVEQFYFLRNIFHAGRCGVPRWVTHFLRLGAGSLGVLFQQVSMTYVQCTSLPPATTSHHLIVD